MEISTIIKTVAPWLGAALGGPLGSLAATTACEALGLSDKTTEGLKAALSGASQADLLALKKADQDFASNMQALGFKSQADLEGIAAADRSSARDMQKATRSWVPAALSVIVTLGFFGILSGMLAGVLRLNDSEAMLLMLGSLTTGWGAVMAYWLGSTSSSATKTDIISRSTITSK